MESYDASPSSYGLAHQPTENHPLPPPSRFRRPQSKPTKKPAPPLPTARTRVYKVDPNNFRDLVQKLTGSTLLQSRRLQTLAPPPLEIAPSSSALLSQQNSDYAGAEASLSTSMEDVKVEEGSESSEFLSFLSSNSSPTHDHLSFFPLISPATITCLEHDALV